MSTTTAYSTHFDHLLDMKAQIGQELGLSEWVEITQENINIFANITQDEQWIHVDVERSKKESPYKNTVAHGFYVLSLASKFSYDTLSFGDVVMGVNYGLNKVRFPSPTLSGSFVRGRISLINFEEKSGGAQYVLKVIFEVKDQERPVCVAEFIAQVYTG